MLFLSWDLEYTGLVTNSGPVPFVPWGTSRESRGEVKTIHNEKAPTFPEKEEVGVKDAVMLIYLGKLHGEWQLITMKWYKHAKQHWDFKKYVKMVYNGGGEQASISYRIALKLQ